MNIREAYDQWANQYDTSQNKTRDFEAVSLRETMQNIHVDACLEIGCGTGKNTAWLIEHARELTSVDFSEGMLAQARQKIKSDHVQFIHADITQAWTFAARQYDLITFSLVLEHVEDLNPVFHKAASVLRPGGYIYIGELHPYKQYTGSKARFETSEGQQVVTCFTHHLSDFTHAAIANGFELVHFHEYFDSDIEPPAPRIITFLLKKDSKSRP